MRQLRNWFKDQDWAENLRRESAYEKADILLSQVRGAVKRFLPGKVVRIANDDEPWFTQRLKKMDRRRRRKYNKNRRSNKYLLLGCLNQDNLLKAKKKKQRMIDDVKLANSGDWYSKLKRMTRHNHSKSKEIQVEEISHLTNQEQAELIADKLAEISQSYKGVELTDPVIPPFTVKDILQVSVSKVKEYISRIKPKKSTPPRDIPAKIVEEFSEYLCVPLTDIINTSLKMGPWPSCYKKEVFAICNLGNSHAFFKDNLMRPNFRAAVSNIIN